MEADRNIPYRRIGTILLERRVITADQLALALVEQEETGRPLGEICVEQYGLDRLTLADALAEQWAEMQTAGAGPDAGGADAEAATDIDAEAPHEHVEADELRVLLEEAEAARSELASKTDELGRRIAVLETLVIGVTDALAELRPVTLDQAGGELGNGRSRTAAPRSKRSRAGARASTRRAAST